MALVLDTSAVIALERGSIEWSQVLKAHAGDTLFMPAIVWAELLAGVFLAGSTKRAMARRQRLDGLRSRMPVLDFDERAAVVWAELFSDLQQAGTPIPTNDLCIAATAICHEATLLIGPSGEGHFQRIPSLTTLTIGSS